MSAKRSSIDPAKKLEVASLLTKDLFAHGFGLFCLSGVINILGLTASIYMMQVYDRAIPSSSLPTLTALSAIALALFLFQGGFETIRARIFVRVGARMDQRLSPLAHRLAIDLPRLGYSTTEALERGRSVDTLRGFLAGSAPASILDLPWMPIFLLFVYLVHPLLGAMTLGGALALGLVAAVAELRSRNLTQAAQKALVARNTVADSNARAADVLVSMGLNGRAIRRYEVANAEHLRLQARAADVNAAMASISRIARMILQSALLGVGAMLVIEGKMSAGSIMAVSVASGRALAPIDQIIGNWRGLLGARHAWAQLSEALAATRAPRIAMELPRPKSGLSVQGLSIASPVTGRVLLTDVSFEVPAGQALAILGPSGGGKSTLLRALAGVWPALRGAIRIDGTELNQWQPDQIGALTGYLPQEVNLFNGTVLENISRLEENPESAAVLKAAQWAGVHQMIQDLPEGYQTKIGPQGSTLSAGQRQRIGLARAVYGAPFLVLLDEPNAALDAVGETQLNDCIRALKAAGAIVIVVAHRPNVLEAVDLLGVIHGGRLAAFGPRAEVLAKTSARPGKVVPFEPSDAPAAIPATAAR